MEADLLTAESLHARLHATGMKHFAVSVRTARRWSRRHQRAWDGLRTHEGDVGVDGADLRHWCKRPLLSEVEALLQALSRVPWTSATFTSWRLEDYTGEAIETTFTILNPETTA